MQVEVKIIKTVVTQQYGTLVNGDILKTDRAFAQHLVDECGAAQFTAAAGGESKQAAARPKRQSRAKDGAE